MTTSFASEAQLIASLMSYDITEQEARLIVDAAKPGVWFATKQVDDESCIPVGATKIGGMPDLPIGMAWPMRPAYPDEASNVMRRREGAEHPEKVWRDPYNNAKQRAELQQFAAERLSALSAPAYLGFVAQFNFADLCAVGPLDPDMPTTGILSLFYDLGEKPWGYDPNETVGYKVIYKDAPKESLVRQRPPDELPTNERLGSLDCAPRFCLTPPDRSMVDELAGISKDSMDAYGDWYPGPWEDESSELEIGDWTSHRVGGWPNEVQDSMEEDCALVAAGHNVGDNAAYKDPALASVRASAVDWILLAQIDDDDRIGAQWVDSGMLYLWIRRDDLRARRFEGAHLILQCC